MPYKIQKSHPFTISDLWKLEKKEKYTSRQRRISAVRMVMAGLLTRKQLPGKKPYLTKLQQGELKQLILNTTPAELHLGQEAFWNTRIIQEKFAIWMSREGIRKMLHRMNFSYTNATYVLKKANKKTNTVSKTIRYDKKT